TGGHVGRHRVAHRPVTAAAAPASDRDPSSVGNRCPIATIAGAHAHAAAAADGSEGEAAGRDSVSATHRCGGRFHGVTDRSNSVIVDADPPPSGGWRRKTALFAGSADIRPAVPT